MLGAPAAAPVTEEALLEVLQGRTIDAWSDELADLRVRPFTDQPSSLLVSGTLGRRDSPLESLFRAVWHEVGGDDRSRSYADQLKVATSFGPMIQFVEQGRMAEIEQVFAGLNVALAALGSDAEVSRRRLMDVQHRAASIATLNQAPRLVVQIIEDVLAQTTASREGGGRPRAALAWQRDLAAACRAALDRPLSLRAGRRRRRPRRGRRLPRADGALARFYAAELAPLLDTGRRPGAGSPRRASRASPRTAPPSSSAPQRSARRSSRPTARSR